MFQVKINNMQINISHNNQHIKRHSMQIKKQCLLFILFISVVISASGQTWDVPADKKTKASPIIFNAETAKKGETTFQLQCKSCHGEPGKANFVNLTPSPGDPATDKFQKQTDGALFYKITNGRVVMPTFKDILTEEERWQLIAYFRSFNKGYTQAPVNGKGIVAEVPAALLTISYNEVKGNIQVLATDTLKKPLTNVPVLLFVKRYFGNLPIGESTPTDDKGIASFEFPKDIPGDKKGNLSVIAKLSGEGIDTKKTEILTLGIPTDKPPLTFNRAMWNVGKKAPIWLIISYCTVVIVIWSFLGYIVMQLVKIRRANKKDIQSITN